MQRMKYWLTGLLLLQILLATGLSWHQYEQASADKPVTLLDFDPNHIDRMQIQDNHTKVELDKVGAQWQTAAYGSLPLNQARITELLHTLHRLKTSWPVSTTTESATRFQVSDQNFSRHVQLFQGKQLKADVYLGSSPSFRQIHIRRAGDNKVYVVNLSTYSVPATTRDWLNKTLIALQNIQQVRGSDYQLDRQAPGDNHWKLAPTVTTGTPVETLDQNKARQLISALSVLQIQDVATKDITDHLTPVTTLTVKDAHGQWTYRFFQTSQNNTPVYLVQRQDHPETFVISAYDFNHIVPINRDKLLQSSNPKPADKSSVPSPASKPEQPHTETH